MAIQPLNNKQGELSFAWAEDFGEDGKPYGITSGWSTNGCTVIKPIQIYFADRFKALREIPGFAIPSGGDKMHRRTPWRCPDYPWMRATQITEMRGLYYQGNSVAGPLGIQVPNYERMRLKVQFNALPFDCLEDGETGTEKDRFVEKHPLQTNTELLNFQPQDHNAFKWAEGTQSGQQVASQVGVAVQRGVIRWIWHAVSAKYVLNASGVPSKINSVVGKVNSATFAGYPAGTLLLEDPKITPICIPGNPEDFALVWTQAALMMQVDLTFKHFDPPPTGATRGHNLLPDPGDPTKWALVQTDGGRQQYDSADFNDIFKQAT